MLGMIKRFVTFDFGTEKLLEKIAGSMKVEVIDDRTAIVEGYQAQMDIYSELKWGMAIE